MKDLTMRDSPVNQKQTGKIPKGNEVEQPMEDVEMEGAEIPRGPPQREEEEEEEDIKDEEDGEQEEPKRAGEVEVEAIKEDEEDEDEEEEEEEEEDQKVLVLKVAKKKTYYVRGKSLQDITLWLFHLLQAQRAEIIPMSSLLSSPPPESRPWLPSAPFPPISSAILSSRLQSFLATQASAAVSRPKKIRHNTFPRLIGSRPGDPIAHFFSIYESSHPATSPLSGCKSAEEVLLTHCVNLAGGAKFFREDQSANGEPPVPLVFTRFQSMEPRAVYICIDNNKEYLRVSRLDDSVVSINGAEFPIHYKNDPSQTPMETESDGQESSIESEVNEEEHDGDDEESEAEGGGGGGGGGAQGKLFSHRSAKGTNLEWGNSAWRSPKPPNFPQRKSGAPIPGITKQELPEQPPRRRRPLSDVVVTEGFLRDLAKKTNLS